MTTIAGEANTGMNNIAEMTETKAAVTGKNTDQAVDTIVRVVRAAHSAITVERGPLRNSLKLLLNSLNQKDKFLRHKAEFTCHHLK